MAETTPGLCLRVSGMPTTIGINSITMMDSGIANLINLFHEVVAEMEAVIMMVIAHMVNINNLVAAEITTAVNRAFPRE
jgi:hypothetical protein